MMAVVADVDFGHLKIVDAVNDVVQLIVMAMALSKEKELLLLAMYSPLFSLLLI